LNNPPTGCSSRGTAWAVSGKQIELKYEIQFDYTISNDVLNDNNEL
jgi:hypothetical protein